MSKLVEEWREGDNKNKDKRENEEVAEASNKCMHKNRQNNEPATPD